MGEGERNDGIRLAATRTAFDRAKLAEALKLVEAWNAKLADGDKPQFSPTIGGALNAGTPWLRLHCPGCRQVYDLDPRGIVGSRDFPITALRLTCESMCRWQARRPELLGLFPTAEQGAAVTR
jgi:hypothetical protein